MGWKYHWKELSQDGLLKEPRANSDESWFTKWDNFASEEDAVKSYEKNAVHGGYGQLAGQPIQGWKLVLIKTYEHDS